MKFNQIINFNSKTQGTIAPSRRTSIAQGTIEYLVIIAIVVVISLVVVALLLGIFENNIEVTNTSKQISAQTQPVAVKEAILGVGNDANGLILLTNNTGGLIKNIRIELDSGEHKYYYSQIAVGESKLFKLNFVNYSCPQGQNTVTREINIYYITRNGLEKKQTIPNLAINCAQTSNPITTINPIEEREQEINLTSCTENDWSFTDGACLENNTLTRTFTKIGNCTGGVTHSPTETVACTYVPNEQTLNLTINGTGTVIINSASYTSSSSISYPTGTSLTITTTTNSDYLFGGWSQDCSGIGTCTITMDSTKNITANFNEITIETIKDGLNSHWAFDETQGTTAYDTYGDNDGSINSVSINQSGVIGTSFQFAGTSNSYVLVNSPIDIPISTSDRTVCAWIHPTTSSHSMTILNYGALNNSSGTAFALMLDEWGEGFKFIFWGAYNDIQSSQTISLNNWTFTCFTYNHLEGKGYLYENGVLKKQGNLSLNTPQQSLRIGGIYVNPWSRGSYFEGKIDELTIWERTLNQKEIAKLHQLNSQEIGLAQ